MILKGPVRKKFKNLKIAMIGFVVLVLVLVLVSSRHFSITSFYWASIRIKSFQRFCGCQPAYFIIKNQRPA